MVLLPLKLLQGPPLPLVGLVAEAQGLGSALDAVARGRKGGLGAGLDAPQAQHLSEARREWRLVLVLRVVEGRRDRGGGGGGGGSELEIQELLCPLERPRNPNPGLNPRLCAPDGRKSSGLVQCRSDSGGRVVVRGGGGDLGGGLEEDVEDLELGWGELGAAGAADSTGEVLQGHLWLPLQPELGSPAEGLRVVGEAGKGLWRFSRGRTGVSVRAREGGLCDGIRRGKGEGEKGKEGPRPWVEGGRIMVWYGQGREGEGGEVYGEGRKGRTEGGRGGAP